MGAPQGWDVSLGGGGGSSTPTLPPPTAPPGVHHPYRHPRKGVQEVDAPIPSMPALLSRDDVWIQHKIRGIPINFWALQRLLTFHEKQRGMEVINLVGQGGSSALTFPVCYMGWVPDPFASRGC